MLKMFDQRMDALITGSKPPKQEALGWLSTFEHLIKSLKYSDEYEIGNYKSYFSKVTLPLPERFLPSKGEKGKFIWSPPQSIKIIGSWRDNTATQKSHFDLAVEIPAGFLNASDYLNYKYHVKKAIYIAGLAKVLQERENVKYSLLNGSILHPTLIVTGRDFTCQLVPFPPPLIFKPSRFRAQTSNVRSKFFFANETKDNINIGEYESLLYNQSILQDLMILENNEMIEATFHESSNYSKAAILFRFWLHKRRLDKGYGAFTNFIMKMLICYLHKVNTISPTMTVSEVFRKVILSLANMDWTTGGIMFAESSYQPMSQWHDQYDVVFIDVTGNLNITANMNEATYFKVRYEALSTLKLINEDDNCNFNSLFINQTDYLIDYDHTIIFPPDAVKEIYANLQSQDQNRSLFVNFSAHIRPIVSTSLIKVLKKCFKKRAKLIGLELSSSSEWDIKQKYFPEDESMYTLKIGLLLNKEFAHKQVEKCESDDVKEVEDFKLFWGDKCQLRRFRDGSMWESVLFDEDPQKITCHSMLEYALSKHFSFKNLDSVIYIHNQILELMEKKYLKSKVKQDLNKARWIHPKRRKLENDEQEKQKDVKIPISQLMSLAVTCFDDLSKMLRQLTDLPLTITSVQAASSMLRFSSVYPCPPQMFLPTSLTEPHKNGKSLLIKYTDDTLPSKIPKYIEPICTIVQLETSGKWPDDLKAISRLKCAFLIRIGELLKQTFGLTCQPSPRYLDVLKDGFIFRIYLTYYRELILLKQMRGPEGVLKVRDNPESLMLEKESLLLPQLTSTLHALHRQYEGFSGSCRLAKRWVASQLLLGTNHCFHRNFHAMDTRFTEESIELLVAYTFLKASSNESLCVEPQTGFLRFLYFLAHFDWKNNAVIVNLNDKLSKESVITIREQFLKRRDTLPPLFISTPDDEMQSVWTKNLSGVILKRAALLAKQALKLISTAFTNISTEKRKATFKAVFRPSLEQFNLILHLEKKMVPRYFQNVDADVNHFLRFKEYQKTREEKIPIVDFDHVQLYLQELRDSFGHLALFLHDTYGGDFIAVVWKPDVFSEQTFSTTSSKSSMLSASGMLSTNFEGTIELMKRMGRGILESVEILQM